MSVEVKVPMLPESVTDATVAAWHKQVGQAVSQEENLVDLETDKVVLEVPAPCDGVIEAIKAEAGATVTQGELLAVIQAGAAATTEAEDKPDDTQAMATPEPEETPALSPSAQRLAAENELDASAIKASGRDGRVTKSDVLEHLKQKPQETARETTPASEPTSATPIAAPALGQRSEERVPMSRLRRRIAERMIEAQSTAAMLTSFNEVNLQTVMAMRKQHKEAFQQRHQVKLGLMSFFVKAACEALRQYPIVNASVDQGDVIYHSFQDIGIAVASDRGLVVPVLRNAEQMSFAQVEKAIAAFGAQARDGSLKLEDLQGGTFTITNGGVFGSLLSTPILNRPQSAILGMHTIKERPVVENGEIVARPMMYLALTYDHRLVDGKDAVLFLVAIKDALEDPHRLLLDL